MNKNDLVAAVATTCGASKAGAAKAVDAVFDAITNALNRGEEVRLIGFGSFQCRQPIGPYGQEPADWRAHFYSSIEAAEVQGWDAVEECSELTAGLGPLSEAPQPRFPRWLPPVADNGSTMGIRPRIRP